MIQLHLQSELIVFNHKNEDNNMAEREALELFIDELIRGDNNGY